MRFRRDGAGRRGILRRLRGDDRAKHRLTKGLFARHAQNIPGHIRKCVRQSDLITLFASEWERRYEDGATGIPRCRISCLDLPLLGDKMKREKRELTSRELAVFRKRGVKSPGGPVEVVTVFESSDPISIMGCPHIEGLEAMEKQLDLQHRQRLEQVIAQLAFYVNKPGALETFGTLAELMEEAGHTPSEIAGAFRAHLRPKRFSSPNDMPGDKSFNSANEK